MISDIGKFSPATSDDLEATFNQRRVGALIRKHGALSEKREHKQPKQNERKVMNYRFDELAKSMAQSFTRRGALKKFGVGLASIALAAMEVAKNAHADKGGVKHCGGCIPPYFGCDPHD